MRTLASLIFALFVSPLGIRFPILRKIVILIPVKGGKLRMLLRPFTSDLVYIIESFYYEPYTNYYELRNGDVVVDLGAYIGDSTVAFYGKIKLEGKIIAIEPSMENYNMLLRNLESNKTNNVITMNIGLGSKKEIKYLDTKVAPAGFKVVNNGVYRIDIEKLDNLSELVGDCIDLLKIDVEGFGLEVLKGSINYLKSIKVRNIAMEIHDGEEEGAKALLQSLGYDVIIDGGYLYARARLV
jgi:FkbM family methyltransferase